MTLKNKDTKSTTSTTLPEKFVDDFSAWQVQQNRKCYQLSKPEIEFAVMKEMYAALGMHTCSEKMTF